MNRWLTMLAVCGALTACQSSGGSTDSGQSVAGPPANGVAQDDPMAQACQGAITKQLQDGAVNLNMGPVEDLPGGGFDIPGTADLGNQGVKNFKCTFDAGRRLTGATI